MDTRVKTDMPLIRDLYNIFVGEVCPPQGLLVSSRYCRVTLDRVRGADDEPVQSAWSAQFVVSKRRILANAYK